MYSEANQCHSILAIKRTFIFANPTMSNSNSHKNESSSNTDLTVESNRKVETDLDISSMNLACYYIDYWILYWRLLALYRPNLTMVCAVLYFISVYTITIVSFTELTLSSGIC